MKKLFFFAALTIMLITASCKSNDPLDRSTYVGKFYVASTGSLEYTKDDGSTQNIPVALVDTVNIALDPNSSDGLICTGKLFYGNVKVTENGIKFNDITYIKEDEGTAYSYGLSLIISNEYAKIDSFGFLNWKSNLTGTATGTTIGIGIEKSVTGTLTNIGVKKL